MSGLDEHLDRYLALRRSVGFRAQGATTVVLSDFVRYAQARGETTVRAETALAWAGEGSTDGARARRLSMARGLARYLSAFDPATEIPPRGPFSEAARSTPHIFSESEIARVMRAAGELVPARFGATMATLIGLMASTGLRPAEVRRLDRGDVDLAAGQITVWHSKSGRSRRLPVHDSTVEALADYAAIRDCGPAPRDEAFFPNCRGARLSARCSLDGVPRPARARVDHDSGSAAAGADRRSAPHLRGHHDPVLAPDRRPTCSSSCRCSRPTSGTSTPPRPIGTCRARPSS